MIVLGALKGWWIPGYLYERERERANRNEELLFRALQAAEKIGTVAEKTAKAALP